MKTQSTPLRRFPEQSRPQILWVDDDVYFVSHLIGYVRDVGFDVTLVKGPDEALEALSSDGYRIALVILDMMMPPGKSLHELETKGGYATGLALARRVLRDYPGLPILAFSVAADAETMEWFSANTSGYLVKPARTADVVRAIQRALGSGPDEAFSGPRSFIVHGHDDALLYELKDFLRSTLGFPNPVVLREQPSEGRTIIEKFEAAAADTDLVFVLLTPDDEIVASHGGSVRRARQNVVFELGFFFAKLQRDSGRVIVLHKGPLEIPSDIAGIIYIDVHNGIESAGEKIRRELKRWLEG